MTEREQIQFSRVWAMPNKWTFQMEPIAKLLGRFITNPNKWADPFAGTSVWASVSNDLNPERGAVHSMDALLFLKKQKTETFDGVLFDPPYSPQQVIESYEGVGLPVPPGATRADYYTKLKREIARITKPGGVVISFGWNSGGIGKCLGFRLFEIMLVAHGGHHNDTVVTVERKIQYRLEAGD